MEKVSRRPPPSPLHIQTPLNTVGFDGVSPAAVCGLPPYRYNLFSRVEGGLVPIAAGVQIHIQEAGTTWLRVKPDHNPSSLYHLGLPPHPSPTPCPLPISSIPFTQTYTAPSCAHACPSHPMYLFVFLIRRSHSISFTRAYIYMLACFALPRSGASATTRRRSCWRWEGEPL